MTGVWNQPAIWISALSLSFKIDICDSHRMGRNLDFTLRFLHHAGRRRLVGAAEAPSRWAHAAPSFPAGFPSPAHPRKVTAIRMTVNRTAIFCFSHDSTLFCMNNDSHIIIIMHGVLLFHYRRTDRITEGRIFLPRTRTKLHKCSSIESGRCCGQGFLQIYINFAIKLI